MKFVLALLAWAVPSLFFQSLDAKAWEPASAAAASECECAKYQHYWFGCTAACDWENLQFACWDAEPCEQGCHWLLSGAVKCGSMTIGKIVQASSQDPGPEHEPIQCTTEGRIIVPCPTGYGPGKFWTGVVSCLSCQPQGG